MLNFDKLTVKAQQALQAAQEMGGREGQQQIEPLHLLWALLAQGDGVVPPLLEKLGVSPTQLAGEVEKQIARLPKVSGVSQQYLAPATNKILETAFDEAQRLKDEYVSTEHILLAISAAEKDPAGQILKRAGASHDAILQAMATIRGSHRVTSQNPESTYRALEQYGRDLTDLARRGKLDPVIGRDEEIRRVMQILARRTKNNPVLIGEPGVGKTAIVEGLGEPHRGGRRSGSAEAEADCFAGSFGAGGRREIPRRIRRPAEGGAEGSDRVRRPDHSVH